jgi:hypothetical protein
MLAHLKVVYPDHTDRVLVNMGCDGKQQYRNKLLAQRAMRNVTDRRATAYHCTSCGWWHWGHQRRSTREISCNDI